VDASAVVELRRARRHRRLQKLDVSEALYRGYLTAIAVAIGIWALSNLPADHRLTPRQVAAVVQHGPALVAAFVAAYLAVSYFEKPDREEGSAPARAPGKKNSPDTVETPGG